MCSLTGNQLKTLDHRHEGKTMARTTVVNNKDVFFTTRQWSGSSNEVRLSDSVSKRGGKKSQSERCEQRERRTKRDTQDSRER